MKESCVSCIFKFQKQETDFEEEFDNVSKKINSLMPKKFEGHKLNAFGGYHQNFLKNTGKIKVSRPSLAWRRVTKNNCEFGGKYFVNTPKSCLYFFWNMVGFQILESRSSFWKPNNLVEYFSKTSIEKAIPGRGWLRHHRRIWKFVFA